MILHDFQQSALADLHSLVSAGKRPLLVSPTGSGKTVIGRHLVERLDGEVYWVAHRWELIDQAVRHLEDVGARVGVIKAGRPATPSAKIQVCSIQTLQRRKFERPAHVVVDEAHHAVADGYACVMACQSVIGLTATPFRLDGRGLGELFTDLVVAARPDELCERGLLLKPQVYGTVAPDVRGVKIRAGDFALDTLATRMNTPGLVADIVREWYRLAGGRWTICFAVNIPHSLAIVEAFRAAGVAAEHLDGNTPPAERDAILARLASGETTLVSNVGVLTEGYDLPLLDCVILARPTASLVLHLQMVGRCMRTAPGKPQPIVIDMAGNHHRHGFVTRRLEYSLDGSKSVTPTEPLGLRRCESCGLFYDSSLWSCPECGEPVAKAGPPRAGEYESPGELQELDDTSYEYRRRFWSIIEAERLEDGRKPGWATFRFKERFGVWPVLADHNGIRRLVDPERATREEKRNVYEQLASTANAKGFARGWASQRYREIFGTWPRGFVGDVRLQEFAERLRERSA